MSGIAGILRLDGGPVAPGLVERMTDAMAYRGPDGIRHWHGSSAALGHCMLRTTPESLEETLPLLNDDGSLVLVMDGRLDNWKEMRTELLARGARLRTRADAELVLRAYEVWGDRFLEHIDGDFALVIWNTRTREALCARDHIGNKPLVYHWDGKQLIFASEVHAIFAVPCVPQTINRGVLAEYLGNEWFSRDETLWAGVSRVTPAHRMRVGTHGLEHVCYWQPDCFAQLPCSTDQEMADYYLSLLTDRVRRMSRSAYPLACEVSGGLDSSALFALLDRLERRGDLLSPKLDGYGLIFPGDKDADEVAYLRAVAQHIGRPVVEVSPTLHPTTWFEHSARQYRDFPGYPNGSMGTGLRMQAHAAGACVVMTGIGGDERLGGGISGTYYADELSVGSLRNVWRCYAADIRDLGLGPASWLLLRNGLAPHIPLPIRQAIRRLQGQSARAAAELSRDCRRVLDERRSIARARPTPKTGRHAQRLQYRVLTAAYDGLARELEEREAARLGLELRSPFNARALIQWSFSTPERYRTRGRKYKVLHRQAFGRLLPEVVVQRQSKADFMVTFRRQLEAAEQALADATMRREGEWLAPHSTSELIKKFKAGREGGTVEWVLWTILGCHWLDEK